MQKEYLTYPFPTRFTTPLAVAHVTIIPMDTGRLLVDQTLLIEGGRIVAMRPSSSFELPPGFAVVEGTGKYLMSGLALPTSMCERNILQDSGCYNTIKSGYDLSYDRAWFCRWRSVGG